MFPNFFHAFFIPRVQYGSVLLIFEASATRQQRSAMLEGLSKNKSG